MTPRLSGPLAEALRDGRDRYNAAFAGQRRRRPDLSGERFAGHLAAVGDPLVRAVTARDSSYRTAIVDAAHDVLLALVARDLDETCPAMLEALGGLASSMPAGLMTSPRRVLAATANATHRIASMRPEAAPAWLARLDAVARASSALPADSRAPDTFFEALGIAAWSLGVPMLRARALDALRTLPEALGLAALGLERATCTASELAGKLHQDPWSSPERLARGEAAAPRFEVVAITGGFRGFGGPFLQPPVVTCRDGRLFAVTPEATFAVWADRMGTWLESCGALAEQGGARDDGEVAASSALATDDGSLRTSLALLSDGTVDGFGRRSSQDLLGGRPIASWAAHAGTLVAVPSRSHHLLVVALVETT